jgi:hypothetical protein
LWIITTKKVGQKQNERQPSPATRPFLPSILKILDYMYSWNIRQGVCTNRFSLPPHRREKPVNNTGNNKESIGIANRSFVHILCFGLSTEAFDEKPDDTLMTNNLKVLEATNRFFRSSFGMDHR